MIQIFSELCLSHSNPVQPNNNFTLLIIIKVYYYHIHGVKGDFNLTYSKIATFHEIFRNYDDQNPLLISVNLKTPHSSVQQAENQ